MNENIDVAEIAELIKHAQLQLASLAASAGYDLDGPDNNRLSTARTDLSNVILLLTKSAA